LIKKETQSNKKGKANLMLKNLQNSFSANKPLYLAIAVYIIALSAFTILRERAFLTSGFDLGIFNQAFSTTIHNHRFFYETGDLSFNPNGNFFGVHFSPILFILLPFYAIYPSPEILLVMQTIILALGALPVYWIGRIKLGTKMGQFIAILYLCYSPVIFLNLSDFHLEAFTSTFFLFSLYFLENEEWGKFFLFLILSLSTIEFAPIIGVFVALYTFIILKKRKIVDSKRAKKYILLIAILSIFWLILALQIKGLLNVSTSPLPSTFQSLWQNPMNLVNTFIADGQTKTMYILVLFAPLAFIPFLAPEALLMSLPWIATSFLSTYPLYYSIYYQYTGFVIPFLFLALPTAITRVKFRKAKKIIPALLVISLIFGYYLPTIQWTPWNFQIPESNNRTQALNQILSLIPANASILTENDIFPHLSNRPEAYMYIPESDKSVDYVLADLNSIWFTWQPDISGRRISLNEYSQKALSEGVYGVYASIGSVILLKKGYTEKPVLFVSYSLKEDYNNLILTSGSNQKDNTAESKKILFHNASDATGNFWYGPYIRLPPGLYNITYVIKFGYTKGINQSDQLLTVEVTANSGRIMLASKQIYNSDSPANNQWFNVSSTFTLHTVTEGVEFIGRVDGNQTISLDRILVKQIEPLPNNGTDLAFNNENLSSLFETNAHLEASLNFIR
jgi:uncharacterized membrane protein